MDEETLKDFESSTEIDKFLLWIFKHRDFIYIAVIVILVIALSVYKKDIMMCKEFMADINSTRLLQVRP